MAGPKTPSPTCFLCWEQEPQESIGQMEYHIVEELLAHPQTAMRDGQSVAPSESRVRWRFEPLGLQTPPQGKKVVLLLAIAR